MAILTYPLNGIQYNAEDAEAYLCTRESGVYSAENNFALEITDAMQVTIGKGIAWIKNEDFAGKVVKNDGDIAITIPIADGIFNRIDRIVIQFDKASNTTNIVLKQGTAANFPVAPFLVRDDIIYELGLYEIAVNAGVVEITNENIKNTMLDETVCGLMRDGVTKIPTETLQKQAEEIIDQIRKVLENVVSENIPPHAFTHSRGGEDEISPSSIGAVSFFEQNLSDEQKEMARKNIGADEDNINLVTMNGDIEVTIQKNTEYTFNSVTSLKIIGTIEDAHGFIGFASSVPTISIVGFNGMSGDDITSARADEIWEFSCKDGFAIWHNWTEATVGTSASGTVVVDGGYYIPSVDNDGNLSWSASKPNMILPTSANIRGERGPQGLQGEKGEDGKSAYESAQEGGYTGTEEEFYESLNNPLFSGNTGDTTPQEVTEALVEGKTILLNHTDSVFGIIFFSNFTYATATNVVVASVAFEMDGKLYNANLMGMVESNTWSFAVVQLATLNDIPEEKIVTNVDLSKYESEGIIVETYADSSTLTHNFEFNEDEKPIKITDSDGNEITLTW